MCPVLSSVRLCQSSYDDYIDLYCTLFTPGRAYFSVIVLFFSMIIIAVFGVTVVVVVALLYISIAICLKY